jgi:hypothetical protein
MVRLPPRRCDEESAWFSQKSDDQTVIPLWAKSAECCAERVGGGDDDSPLKEESGEPNSASSVGPSMLSSSSSSSSFSWSNRLDSAAATVAAVGNVHGDNVVEVLHGILLVLLTGLGVTLSTTAVGPDSC